MHLFNDNEILVMMVIVGVLVFFIFMLVIIDISTAIKRKKINKKNKIEVIEEEPVIEVKNIPKGSMTEILEDIEIIEDEPIIEPIKMVHEEITCDDLIESNNELLYHEISVRKDPKIELEEIKTQMEECQDNGESITNFELEQEENAIISYEELAKIGNNLYDSNEIMQYDDGNEPITIDEVIKMFNTSNEEEIVVKEEDKVLDNKPIYQTVEHVPFISSVYGLEKSKNELTFENTATYEKLNKNQNDDFLTKLQEAHEKTN